MVDLGMDGLCGVVTFSLWYLRRPTSGGTGKGLGEMAGPGETPGKGISKGGEWSGLGNGLGLIGRLRGKQHFDRLVTR